MNGLMVRLSSVAAVFMVVLSLGFVFLGLNVGLSVSYALDGRVLAAAQVFVFFYALWVVCFWGSWAGFRVAAYREGVPVVGFAAASAARMSGVFLLVTAVVGLMVVACLSVI